MLLRPGTVDFDEGPQYPCLLSPNTWNGWAMPYFAKEQADAVAAVVGGTTYDPETDTFSTKFEDDDDDEAEPWETVEVDGVMYYGIGAGSWTWNYPEEDPWRGNLVAGVWHMLRAFMRILWSRAKLNPDETPALRAVMDATGHCEDEDELRTIIADALAKVDEVKAPISPLLRQHAEAVVAGENPFA
jgi:hypothetical protein